MEPTALIKAATDDPSSEGDIIFHLCEKIRELSQQLLDSQKKCASYETLGLDNTSPREVQLATKVKELERKLEDLMRPIPMSDALSFPPPSVSLSISQLMELYSLLYVRMNEVLKEKEELQTNLHEEILFSEEQSVLIETLREEMSTSKDSSEAQVAHFRSASSQTNPVERQENGKKSSPDDSRIPDLQEKLQQKSESLADSYAEISRLEEEKNALLEYIEQQSSTNDKNQKEISQLKSQLKTMTEDFESRSISQSPNVLQKPRNGEELTQTMDELSALRSAYEKTMLEMEELEDQNQAMQHIVSGSKDVISDLEAHIARLETRENSQSSEKCQKELESLKLKHAETLQLLEELKDFKKSEEEAELSVMQESMSQRMEEENKSLRGMLTQLQTDIETLQTQNFAYKQEISNLKQIKPVPSTEDKGIATDSAYSTVLTQAQLCKSQIETLTLNFSALLADLTAHS